jgi:hypothetical protein
MNPNGILDGTGETLLLGLMEWLDSKARTYEEVMSTWRTTCPRFPIWEEANDRGLVARELVEDREMVCLTNAGKAVLRKYRFMSVMRDYLQGAF